MNMSGFIHKKLVVKIKIIYDAGCVSAEQLATMLEKAGQFVGIGEWRNSSKKSGSFGAFEIQ